MIENWQSVVGYEGLYEVSDLGRVRSVWRTVWRDGPQYSRPHRITYQGCVLAVHPKRTGYFNSVLWQEGRAHNYHVHRLVLEAFVGPCPVGMESLHDNGVRHDNRVANLRWGTPQENYDDRIRHGTIPSRDQGRCKRDHLLQAPNLRPDKAARACLACHRALSSWYWLERDKPGRGVDRAGWVQERADHNYQQIMAGSQERADSNGQVRK